MIWWFNDVLRFTAIYQSKSQTRINSWTLTLCSSGVNQPRVGLHNIMYIASHTCMTPNNKIDSLRWFSQRRSPAPHFGGAHPGGLWPPISNSAEIFVQCTYPRVSSSYVYSFGSYRVDKQTNRRRWKHPTLFATLWRWVGQRQWLSRAALNSTIRHIWTRFTVMRSIKLNVIANCRLPAFSDSSHSKLIAAAQQFAVIVRFTAFCAAICKRRTVKCDYNGDCSSWFSCITRVGEIAQKQSNWKLNVKPLGPMWWHLTDILQSNAEHFQFRSLETSSCR